MRDFIVINEKDNVAVALKFLSGGKCVNVNGKNIELKNDIPMGHKFLLEDLSEGSNIIKYGYPIGYLLSNAKAGEHIHTHNIKTLLGDNLEYEYNPVLKNEDVEYTDIPLTFNGYERKNGDVGIRNEIWIIPTVGCVNSIVKMIADKAKTGMPDNIDDIVSFAHPYGCSQMGEDQENSRKAIASLVNHPNAGGVLLVGLGCENSSIDVLKEYIGDYDADRVRFLNCQDEEDELEKGISYVNELIRVMKSDKRSEQPVSKLIVGLKCGGSDGFSGITANPVVGKFSDVLTQNNGSTILTEVPEMFGAETILMDRAVDKEVFEKIVDMINGFKEYYRFHNQTIYENPSPGNKAGGISTLEDKALGCTQKSGDSLVVDVLPYAKKLETEGLNLLYSPGNDLVASTALALSGAQIVLFTTGRGTPFATVVPTVKISTNSDLYNKKKNWIDFDCGPVLEENESIDDYGIKLYKYVIDIANGSKVKSEEAGGRDLAIFKQGVTL